MCACRGYYCVAISAMGGIVSEGFGNTLGSIPTSMHAALLKYRLWILWHMYRACLVDFPWTMNSTRSQPWHISAKLPTAWMNSLDRMRLFIVSPIFRRSLSPWRHMLAPLSVKIVILVLRPLGISLACLGSGFVENSIIYASISLIWLVSLDVYVPVVWLNVMWALSVSIAALLAPGLFLTAWGGIPSIGDWASHNYYMFFPMLGILAGGIRFERRHAVGCHNIDKSGGSV